MAEQFLWIEKYRPDRIADCVLPVEIQADMESILKEGSIPNLIMTGTAGTGKTTTAIALCKELDVDWLKINGSLERNIDTLRGTILRFASSVSMFSGKRKMIILDEADHLNKQSTQPALRAFMEDYAENCGFILTCNYLNQLIEPLWSRSPPLEYSYPKHDTPEAKTLMMKYLKRCQTILETEEIPYENKALAALIKKYYPDWRMILNIMQRYSLRGSIDVGVLAARSYSIADLVPMLKSKNFKDMRQWVADNDDTNASFIFRALYDHLYDYLVPATIPPAVLILNEGQKGDAIVADKELNIVATLTELMANTEFR